MPNPITDTEKMNNGHVPFISMREVEKVYVEENLAERRVLHSMDINIQKGEIIVILGRSGSGKSTILNLLSGIDYPTSGRIIIDNQEITKLTEKQRTLFRRRNIGFIFQFFNLLPTLTVEENLLLPLELNGNDLRKGKPSALKLLSEVDLSSRANSYPDRLSGGEQQRIAIARALIHDPSIILADEPTGNLDYETGLLVINLLDKLVRKNKKTMIMVTHSKEVIGLADRILTIKEGRVVETSRSEVL